jgi:DNA-directed RNA polymerase subunit E'/Rpb7
VTFRLLVFRPFVGEVLVGRVKHCTEAGVIGTDTYTFGLSKFLIRTKMV